MTPNDIRLEDDTVFTNEQFELEDFNSLSDSLFVHYAVFRLADTVSVYGPSAEHGLRRECLHRGCAHQPGHWQGAVERWPAWMAPGDRAGI
ncbi:MAG: hypothetical protein ACRD59_18625 [Candidatus Acidiferrales bacterium]